jgi:hypothetical protein
MKGFWGIVLCLLAVPLAGYSVIWSAAWLWDNSLGLRDLHYLSCKVNPTEYRDCERKLQLGADYDKDDEPTEAK